MTQNWAPETVVVETGRPPREHDAALNPPITLTSTFIGTAGIEDGGRQYGRYGNPTWEPFEAALAELEGSALPGLVFASGLAAVTAALDLVAPGGTVIMPRHCYLGALSGAQESAAAGRFRIVTVDIEDTAEVTAAIDAAVAGAGDGTSGGARSVLLWLESPTNPMLEVADLPALLAHARAAGALSVVDNTFATPLVQKPLEHGADVALHSVTKSLSGHSDVVLGATVTADPELRELLHHHRSVRGGIAGPFEVWLALRGLRTLALRVERSQANALALAERLSEYPGLEVRFPGLATDPGHARAAAQMTGFGSILCIVLPTAEAARTVTESVRLWTPATSLGGVESLIERRRRHAAEPESIPEGLLRLSVGIEHVDDLWADLEQALDTALR
ncbi:PLP-dependent aspartate aminotransferase family protein [Brevibacterium sp. CS2]|uniref:trans-sulfuration enzyme family protein n=1 Tax=Brevibacterium sp. CS2 TaxID=2575923 RepID=UPI0010C77F92|nr:PLP-dependent aspartate aminotransferase family protein [Brevibacterium sp. CS2]QCP04983.1 PLP-dependent transferase [Brevibacterium sp. CS2]